MNLLLDTHIALWALTDDPKLPPAARELLLDPENTVTVSAASVWEVAIKHARHPDSVTVSGQEVLRDFGEAGYRLLPITARHAATVDSLPPIHQDPFDRILVAQAIAEPLRLVSHDPRVAAYTDLVIPV
ncbi:MAG: type II toxin-antitoxin system VapC family toxin [Bifidobacteriaceae bacterium]|nr:type II toxin-antitoxin system VapC family toxin [Bifidobacteriaceae bacterium]